MKILYTSLLFLMNCVLSVAQPEVIIPKPHQLKWHEAEMGAVFHYDLHVFDGIRYGQGNNRISPIEDYNIFNPTQLDTDQWIQAAKAAGCKFAVLTATHETGFGLWQSDVNPYCLKAVKWRDGKGDIVRDFVNSCRKYGIQPEESNFLTASVVLEGETIAEYELSTLTGPVTLVVDEAPYPLTIQAEPGRIRIAESACPSQDCVHTGWISRAGQQIICLPDKLVISLSGSGSQEFDAISG